MTSGVEVSMIIQCKFSLFLTLSKTNVYFLITTRFFGWELVLLFNK